MSICDWSFVEKQQCTFCIMGQQLNYYSELKLLNVGVEKSSFKRALINYNN